MTNEKNQTVVTVDIHIKHLGTKSIRKGVGEGIRLPRHEYEVTLTVPEGERYEGFDLGTMRSEIPKRNIEAISQYDAVVKVWIEGDVFISHDTLTSLRRCIDAVEWWFKCNYQPDFDAHTGKISIS